MGKCAIRNQKPKPKTVFFDELKLAHGTCKCHREVGPKGIPTVYVPYGKGGNIDLFPEGFLWDRWCTIARGDEHTITTPKERTFKIEMWGSMPYMSKTDLHRVIEDLPEATELGRTGEVIEDPVVARVCRQECTSTSIRQQLKHLEPDVGKNELNKSLQTSLGPKKCGRNLNFAQKLSKFSFCELGITWW